MDYQKMDKLFRVEVISSTPNPQQTIYAAMHQCYSEEFVWDEKEQWPDEEQCGDIIIKRLLAGGRGHFGCTENPQITLNCGWFPHSTMQQIRTHRHLTFDVASFRYSGVRIIDAIAKYAELVETEEDYTALDKTVGKVFYLRPEGYYTDRQGKKYNYTEEKRYDDLLFCLDGCERYKERINQGFSEEHARGLIPFDVRQHFVMSGNARSLMHLFDLRMQKAAQLECQQLCELIWPHFEAWAPAIAAWYKETRQWKPRLAP
jgi:thymidylate synthase (FAD)